MPSLYSRDIHYLDFEAHLSSNPKLRKNAPEVEGSIIDMNDLTTWLRPAAHVHVGMSFDIPPKLPSDGLNNSIDQSPAAVLKRIQLQLPNEAERLLKGRVRIIKCVKPFSV